jgi:hypothetical protein
MFICRRPSPVAGPGDRLPSGRFRAYAFESAPAIELRRVRGFGTGNPLFVITGILL